MIDKGASIFPLLKIISLYSRLENLINWVHPDKWLSYQNTTICHLAVESGQYCQQNLIFLLKKLSLLNKNESCFNALSPEGLTPYQTALVTGTALINGYIPALRILDSFSFIDTRRPVPLISGENTIDVPPLGAAIANLKMDSVKYLFLTLPYVTLQEQYQASLDYLKNLIKINSTSSNKNAQNIGKQIHANLTALEGYLRAPKASYLTLRNEMNIPTPTFKLTMLYAVIQDDYFHVPSAPLEDPQQEKNRRFLKIMSQLNKDALNPFLSAVKGHCLPSVFDSDGIIIGNPNTIEIRALINGGFSTQT